MDSACIPACICDLGLGLGLIIRLMLRLGLGLGKEGEWVDLFRHSYRLWLRLGLRFRIRFKHRRTLMFIVRLALIIRSHAG